MDNVTNLSFAHEIKLTKNLIVYYDKNTKQSSDFWKANNRNFSPVSKSHIGKNTKEEK